MLHKLTDQQIRKTQPRERAFKLYDGGGLYVHVMPSGTRTFRYAYRNPDTSKPSTFTIGEYGKHVDQVTLSDEREHHR